MELRALEAVARHESGHAVAAECLAGAPASITITRFQRDGDTWFRGRCIHVEPMFEEGRLLVSLAGPAAEAMFLAPHATGADLRRALWRSASVSDRAGCNVFNATDRTLDAILNFVLQRRAAIAARASIEVHRFLSSTTGRRGGSASVTFPRKA